MSGIELPGFRVLNVTPQAPPPIPYGVRMIGAELEWSETQGENVKVAIVDTGIAPHPDLKLAGFYDATTGGKVPVDKNGHGTHCAGIVAANGFIKGVAPKVDLYGVRIFGDDGKTTEPLIAKGLQWCLENGMDVVSMSFGGPREMPNAYKVLLSLHLRGAVLVSSAGNYGRDFPEMYPAAYRQVISVAAVDVEKKAAEWSSYHDTVELAAAGVEVYSTYVNNQYALLSGTSMACPHISGAVALIVAKLRKRGMPVTPDNIRFAMALYADDLGLPGKDDRYGYGLFSFGRVEGGQVAPDRPKNRMTLEIDNKRYWHNGQEKTADVPATVTNGRTMTPARLVAEGLGANVTWVPPVAGEHRGKVDIEG